MLPPELLMHLRQRTLPLEDVVCFQAVKVQRWVKYMHVRLQLTQPPPPTVLLAFLQDENSLCLG